MAGLAAAVTLLGAGEAATATAAAGLSAIARNVTFLAALVARLGLGLLGTITRNVAFSTAVIASGSSSFGTICSLMTDY